MLVASLPKPAESKEKAEHPTFAQMIVFASQMTVLSAKCQIHSPTCLSQA